MVAAHRLFRSLVVFGMSRHGDLVKTWCWLFKIHFTTSLSVTRTHTSHSMWHVINAAIRGVVTAKLKSPNMSVVVKHFPHLPDDIPLWATVTARRAFAPPNEELESGVVHSAGSTAAQRTAVWRGRNMTGHDTTPCTLEEVSSTGAASETPLVH